LLIESLLQQYVIINGKELHELSQVFEIRLRFQDHLLVATEEGEIILLLLLLGLDLL
jgi:hypothetical protein